MRSVALILVVVLFGGCGRDDETGAADGGILQDASAEDFGITDSGHRDMATTSDMGEPEDMTSSTDASDPADGAATDMTQTMPDMGQLGPLCYFPAGELYFPPTVVGVQASTSAFSFGTVSIWNCSEADVVVTDVAMAEGTDAEIVIDFAPFTADSLTLEPGETMRVELRFAPEAEGVFTGALEVTHGGGQVDSVSLRGEGIADPGHCRLALGSTLIDPTALSRSVVQVESIDVGGSFNDNFVLANVGRTECNVQSITLDSPSGVFSFPFPNQVGTPTTLSFRQLRVINISFDPVSAGPHVGTITMMSDDGTTPTHVLEVRGETL